MGFAYYLFSRISNYLVNIINFNSSNRSEYPGHDRRPVGVCTKIYTSHSWRPNDKYFRFRLKIQNPLSLVSIVGRSGHRRYVVFIVLNLLIIIE
jgi:hypothetical protein